MADEKEGDKKDRNRKKENDERDDISGNGKEEDFLLTKDDGSAKPDERKRKFEEEKPTKSTLTAKKSSTGIAMKLDSKPKETSETLVQEKKAKLASIFNDDSDSEEEMPLECRMKMRNIGRDTATSSGPKSFNKGKRGFTNNSFKIFELSMKPRNNLEKQTLYDQK